MPDRCRHNVLLMVDLQLAGWPEQRVRVRDISAGGLKVMAAVKPAIGTLVRVDLPGLGWIGGAVAWANDSAFGVRFAHAFDAAAARQRVSGDFRVAPAPQVVLRRVA